MHGVGPYRGLKKIEPPPMRFRHGFKRGDYVCASIADSFGIVRAVVTGRVYRVGGKAASVRTDDGRILAVRPRLLELAPEPADA